MFLNLLPFDNRMPQGLRKVKHTFKYENFKNLPNYRTYAGNENVELKKK